MGIPRGMRHNLKKKALANKTNISAIVKQYLDGYIAGEKNFEPTEKKMNFGDRITLMIPKDMRYTLRAKVANDQTDVTTIVSQYLEEYLSDNSNLLPLCTSCANASNVVSV